MHEAWTSLTTTNRQIMALLEEPGLGFAFPARIVRIQQESAPTGRGRRKKA